MDGNKSEGSWSGMRKYLETEMLADSLKKRISYICTEYPNTDGCKTIELRVDKKTVKRFSWETVNSYFIDNGLKSESEHFGKHGYWDGFFELLSKIPMSSRTEYTDEEFCDALAQYRNQSIEKSVGSSNPIVRMFALFDRRTGKRTLEKMKENRGEMPEWLADIYNIRLKAEGIA